MRLRKKYSIKNKVILIIILLIVSIFLVLKFINKKVSPILFEYAEIESRKLASIVINDAILNNISEDVDITNLFFITRDSNNEIKTIDFNSIEVNKLLTKITNTIQMDLENIEQGNIESLTYLSGYNVNKLEEGIIYEIPSGVIFGNSFLANIGPKIPVKFSLVGDIVSNVNTKVTNYGINNALIEVSINLELREQVILPFVTNEIKIETSIPVALKLIQGNIPDYYFNGITENSPSLSIPMQ